MPSITKCQLQLVHDAAVISLAADAAIAVVTVSAMDELSYGSLRREFTHPDEQRLCYRNSHRFDGIARPKLIAIDVVFASGGTDSIIVGDFPEQGSFDCMTRLGLPATDSCA